LLRKFHCISFLLYRPLQEHQVLPESARTLISPRLAEFGNTCLFAVASHAIFFSRGDAGEHVNGVSILNGVSWRNANSLRLAGNAMPLNQLVGHVNAERAKRKTCQKRSHSRHVDSRSVQVIAEEIAESAIDARIEAGASRIHDQEANSADA